MRSDQRKNSGPPRRGVGKSGKIGRPFEPGQCGNPGGRPKNPFPGLIRKATKDGQEIVQVVLKIMRTSQSEKVRMWAAEFLRDTGWCKPVQGIRSVDDEGNDAPLGIIYERA